MSPTPSEVPHDGQPPPLSIEVARRLGRRHAPVRVALLESRRQDGSSLLAELSRSGGASLKLLLTLLWLGGAPPHEVRLARATYAELCAFPDAAGAGARRASSALARLAGLGLVTVRERPGRPAVVQLLEETGAGVPYRHPGAASAGDEARRHRYVKLPAELWTERWMADVHGAGLAALLILLARGGPEGRPVWMSPRHARETYGLTTHALAAGLRELSDGGLVEVGRAVVRANPAAQGRARNVYRLRLGRLHSPP